MAEDCLTRSPISFGTCLEPGGGMALERYAVLHETLLSHLGADIASLFAEPLISRGNDKAAPSLSWHRDAERGGVPLCRLDDSGRASVEATVSRELRAIRTLIDNPKTARWWRRHCTCRGRTTCGRWAAGR